jgi:hypothetical protein
MAQLSNFVLTPQTHTFIKYDRTVDDFARAVMRTFGSVEVFEDTFAPGRALVIQQNAGQYTVVGVVDPTQWLGHNFGVWSVQDNSAMQGLGNGQGYTQVD